MTKLKNFGLLFYFFLSVISLTSCSDDAEGDNDYNENQKIVDTKWVLKNWDYSLGDDYIGLHNETFNFYFHSLTEGTFYYGRKDSYSDQDDSSERVVCHFKYTLNGDKIQLDYITDKYLSNTLLTLENDVLKAGGLEFSKNVISYQDTKFLNTVYGSCGKCTWYSDLNGKLWIVGKGEMANYASYEKTPWAKNGRDPNTVIINEGVSKIGSCAFANPSIVDVEMPNKSLREIGDAAFKGASIESVMIGQYTTTIGREAFCNCKNLKNLNIPGNLVLVGEYAFSGTALDELILEFGDKTKIIGDFAFEGGKVAYLTFAEGVQKISTGAFLGDYCGVSKKLVLPNSLNTLGATVFEGTFNKIVIGTGLAEIGENAFISSVSSGSLYINQNIPPMSGDNIIVERTNWSPVESRWVLYVPKGCKSEYMKMPPWNRFKSIVEDESLEGNGGDNSDDNYDDGPSNDDAYDENGEYSDLLQDEIDAASHLRGDVADGFSRGSGTSSDPYIISSVEELRYFSDEVRGGNIFKNKYIKLGANITMNRNVLNADGRLNGDGSDFEPWIPIGRLYPTYFFCGTFDGAGYTISGLYCNRPEGQNVGFFGKLRGTVKNLTITDSYFCGYDAVGGIVGAADLQRTDCPTSLLEYYKTNPAVNIISCVNEATVVSNKSMCGGIVGKLNTNAKVTKCMNRGRVVGSRTVGGVVGQSGGDDTEIESCCNDYDVVGEYLVGGIAGQVQETNISNCLNRGYVESASSSSVHGVGGIVGSVRYGYINHNVNSTTEILDLYDNQNVGAICGYVISLEEMKNNYCLYKQGLSVVGKYNDTSGAISSNNRLTESEMKSSSLISTLNSNMSSGWSKWKIGADGFPALSWMD